MQMMNILPYHRIVVVGTTSSGKSTLANRLAKKIGGDFIELDALHWEPNWVEAPNEVFRERVITATSLQSWVLAGNYSIVRDVMSSGNVPKLSFGSIFHSTLFSGDYSHVPFEDPSFKKNCGTATVKISGRT